MGLHNFTQLVGCMVVVVLIVSYLVRDLTQTDIDHHASVIMDEYHLYSMEEDMYVEE